MQPVYVPAASQSPRPRQAPSSIQGEGEGKSPFTKHARYFRDALVRAQYRNAAAKIFPDDTFLMRFCKNTIGEDGGEMNRADMICTRLFEAPSLLRNVNPKDALRKGKDGVRFK